VFRRLSNTERVYRTNRVYDFLVGLNLEYDQVRVQILRKEKVPGINEVVTIIQSEESRRGLMLETPTTENLQ